MEVNEFFDLLESSQGDVVENIKEIIQEHMNSGRSMKGNKVNTWRVTRIFVSDFFS